MICASLDSFLMASPFALYKLCTKANAVKKKRPSDGSCAAEEEKKNAQKKFIEISNAYEILSNPSKRAEYDRAQVHKKPDQHFAILYILRIFLIPLEEFAFEQFLIFKILLKLKVSFE